MASDKPDSDTNISNESLQKVAKGTGLIIIGSLIGILASFIGRLFIIRNWTESDYGIFSLAFAVINIFAIVSTLGLRQGAVRSIAYSRGKKETKEIPKLVSATIYFSLFASLISGLILFLISDIVAVSVFHEPALATPLRIVSIAIPFLTLIDIIVSIFRGFDQLKPTFYFYQILMTILFPVFLIGVIVLKPDFINVFYAFSASLVVTCILLVIYTIKQFSLMNISFSTKSIFSPTAKELFLFSIPLLGTAMLNLIITWTDTLMLGGFKSSVEVGLYNAAHPLARFISFPLSSLLLIYVPIFSGLYAKGKLVEIRRNFSILTKWLCSATLPLFIILFLYPVEITRVLFGSTYVFSSDVLRILSLAFIINNYAGPCGATLVAMGYPRFIMKASLATAVMNIILNIVLIPTFGIVGAAVASGVSIVSINLIKSWRLYSLSKAMPISLNLIKPTVLSIVLIIPLYYLTNRFLTVNWWMLIVLFIVVYGIYLFSVIVTKSLDKEDLNMLQAIETKTGIKIKIFRRILSRFL